MDRPDGVGTGKLATPRAPGLRQDYLIQAHEGRGQGRQLVKVKLIFVCIGAGGVDLDASVYQIPKR